MHSPLRRDVADRVRGFDSAAVSDATADRERALIQRYGVAGLRAIATRALAEGDDYSRELLAEQLEREERHQS